MNTLQTTMSSRNLADLTVLDTAIRQDSAGRFCLNDLHKASGGAAKDKPGNWLASQTTASLIRALWEEVPGWTGQGIPASTSGIPAIAPYETNSGHYGGTYVVKELVYAYAMWISPKFHLQVIRAYDQLVNAPVTPTLPNFLDPAEAAMAWADQYRLAAAQTAQLQLAQAQVIEMKPAAEFVDRYVESKNTQTLGDVVLSHSFIPGYLLISVATPFCKAGRGNPKACLLDIDQGIWGN